VINSVHDVIDCLTFYVIDSSNFVYEGIWLGRPVYELHIITYYMRNWLNFSLSVHLSTPLSLKKISKELNASTGYLRYRYAEYVRIIFERYRAYKKYCRVRIQYQAQSAHLNILPKCRITHQNRDGKRM
jgi:hypothetical protein